MEVFKKGDKGTRIKDIQEFLKIPVDGVFGKHTEAAVKRYQRENLLTIDGIVGNEVLNSMGIISTDLSETYQKGLDIERHYLDPNEYSKQKTNKEYIFLHHTSGWNNPFKTIDDWNTDSRGMIGTEFVIGGQSIYDNDNKYDGKVVKAFPKGHYAWHLGKNGNQNMHIKSVGIELCSFGQLRNQKTYTNQMVNTNQLDILDEPFRGYSMFHKYSESQINSLKLLLLFVANRDSIDIRNGIIKEIHKKGSKAFDYNESAYYGKIKGLWLHVNTRKDKLDLYPSEMLIDMLISL